MAIRIQKIAEDLYTAQVILPDMPWVKSPWETSEPLTGQELLRALAEVRCHQIDIGDAMAQQDSQWVEKLREPYLPPRTLPEGYPGT